ATAFKPTFNSRGHVLSYSLDDQNRLDGFYAGPPAAPALIARVGDPIPAMPPDFTYSHLGSWGKPTPDLNDAGQVAFTAHIAGPAGYDGLGVFLYDPLLGTQLIARSGELFDVGGGELRAVEVWDGMRLSNDGRLAFTLFFDDGNSGVYGSGGIFVATVPEPAGLAAVALALAALCRRRRRDSHTRYRALAAAVAVTCAAPALAVVTSTGGSNPPYSGLDINRHVGADRFYNAGFTGSRTIVTNLEAGHVWNGHESLRHVSTFITHPRVPAPHGDFDRHATWVGGILGGRPGGARQGEWQRGIAYGADLWSGAFAVGWDGLLSFRGSYETHRHAYQTAMIGGVNGRTADVINASYYGTGDRDNRPPPSRIIDAMANQSGKTVVFIAGNEGTTGNPRPGLHANTFNSIAVGALTQQSVPPYSRRVDFSSYGPSDFWNPVTHAVVANAVASIDLAAPGTNLTLALYGGATGGNRGGTVQPGSNLYTANGAGTSFAGPIVSGGAALVVDTGRALFPDNPHATDGRVVKSVLQTSATKTTGWSNATGLVGSVRTTRQGLDHATGAGALNLNQAFTQYTAGTTDLPGLAGGEVQPVGWDFGEVAQGEPVDYFFSTPLGRDTRLTATLNWFLDNSYDYATDTLVDQSLDNLDLEVWRVTAGGDVPDVLVAQSISTYNNVEHLYFQLPETADYMLRVKWTGEVFDTVNDVNRELFAVSWSGTPVPEPAAIVPLLACALPLLTGRRRRRRRSH
ncbi:MAG TPA: S8 family serine peptidase, partial [Tepidisphaeraceae bacterium]|nr:S8 family serine peptidase [Tepidisphaeraceae bacterium]